MSDERKAGTRAPAPPKKAGARKPAVKKPRWDITGISTWGPDKHELGATIPDAGNSDSHITGGWRSEVPVIDVARCDGCMLCYFYCPDASIVIEGGKAVGIDLDHCKGCGICARECPTGAIAMQIDQKE